MLEIGKQITYRKDLTLTGKIEEIDYTKRFNHIIRVTLKNNQTAWFTPGEIADCDDIAEYLLWIDSFHHCPKKHKKYVDILQDETVPLDSDKMIDALNDGLMMYLGTKGVKMKKQERYKVTFQIDEDFLEWWNTTPMKHDNTKMLIAWFGWKSHKEHTEGKD